MCVVKKPDDPLNTDEGQDLSMELNKSQKTSWMPIGTDGGGRCSGVYIKAKTGEDRTGAEKLMFQYTIEFTACIPSGRQRVLLLPVPH